MGKVPNSLQMHKGDRVPTTFKDRMDADIYRATGSLLNLMKRRYPDDWRDRLKNLIDNHKMLRS